MTIHDGGSIDERRGRYRRRDGPAGDAYGHVVDGGGPGLPVEGGGRRGSETSEASGGAPETPGNVTARRSEPQDFGAEQIVKVTADMKTQKSLAGFGGAFNNCTFACHLCPRRLNFDEFDVRHKDYGSDIYCKPSDIYCKPFGRTVCRYREIDDEDAEADQTSTEVAVDVGSISASRRVSDRR